jgi:Tol biopolymer transport system component
LTDFQFLSDGELDIHANAGRRSGASGYTNHDSIVYGVDPARSESPLPSMTRCFATICTILIVSFIQCGCKELGMAAVSGKGRDICYEKLNGDHWAIFVNSAFGGNPQNISNYSGDDEYPEWSPDGRYIAFRRHVLVGGPLICVCDLSTGQIADVTSDGGWADSFPRWTADGRLYFSYERPLLSAPATYIMGPDGSGKRKILDTEATLFFYSDGYTFAYVKDTKIYKSNIDSTLNEFVLDLMPTKDQFVTIGDFDPSTHDLLVNTNMISGSASAIARFSVDARKLSTVIRADSGYTLFSQRYSKDFQMIGFVEYSKDGEYLSVLKYGAKKRLVHIPASTPQVLFSSNRMEFSPDSQWLAYSVQTWNGGSWTEDLYRVDVGSGRVEHIDQGFYPSWNPLY